MSYRSFKHVLGETSLERKCRLLFGGCLLLLITGSFSLFGNQTEKLIDQQNRVTGRLLVDQVVVIKHWRELESRTNKEFSEVVESLSDNLSEQECEWRFIRPNSTDGNAGPRDQFEADLLERFLKANADESPGSEQSEFAERKSPDGNDYQYYQPIRAKESCLKICHAPTPGGDGFDMIGSGTALGGGGLTGGPPLAEGDLMAVVQATIPNGPTQRALNWNRAILLATAIVTVFLAMIASYVIVRYVIVKPLNHLRDVSDAISHGNTALRADIHTGDEFEALALAFNRMLRHMVDAQDELRHVNIDLDGKVDELAQVNMRLYEMNRIKSDFLATMSHELRTPLNSILGFSDVLGSIDALDDKQKRYVENIRKSGRMLLEMINHILDLAKIESGKMDVRLTDFRIEQVVGAQCDMARPLTEKKNIDLEIKVQPDLPKMHQDQARVQQILNNLLSNAIKFTPEGGRIYVSAASDGLAYMLLEVADTGVGIAEDDQQVIFEKFRQGRSEMSSSGDAMTREYSGTGLGLSIVKELSKVLGGEVTVRSELGKGSTFTVRLPLVLEEQPRLDSPMSDGFEQFSKPRADLNREPSDAISRP